MTHQLLIKNDFQFCPCHSGFHDFNCCGTFLEKNTIPDNPSALMRSRYSAYVKEDIDYLLNTWSPAQRPSPDSLITKNTQWVGLQIISEKQLNEYEAEVMFEASYISNNQLCRIQENSLFQLVRGKWLYHSGEGNTECRKITRGESCPCGSEKKYKRCCSK